MRNALFYIADHSPALAFAAEHLRRWGYAVTDSPTEAVTHVLLPVPSRGASLPEGLGPEVTMFGGYLEMSGYRVVDLLKDEEYLAGNAVITAHCAIKVLLRSLERTLEGCEVLVIGWGRIGKALAPLLRALGAQVSIATRSEKERAMLKALGYGAVDTGKMRGGSYRVIFNTAPAAVLSEKDARDEAVLIDLASTEGISGRRVIRARGLPGKEAPESSGELIACTVVRYVTGKETV